MVAALLAGLLLTLGDLLEESAFYLTHMVVQMVQQKVQKVVGCPTV